MSISEKAFQHYINNILEPINCNIPKIRDYVKNTYYIKEVKKGGVFIAQGQNHFDAYYVYKGIFRVYSELPSGNFVNKTFIREGQVFTDNSSYWQKKTCSVSAQALEDCTLLVVSLEDAERKFNEDLDFAKIRLAELKQFKIRHENREILLQTLSIENYYKYILKVFPDVESRIPQYHVASYMGISEVSLSRIKKKLLREKKNQQPI